MSLMRSQKNSLLEEIKESVFDPFNFEWDTSIGKDEDELIEILRYKGTDYKFLILLEEDNIRFGLSPGQNIPFEQSYSYEWDEVLEFFRLWLQYLEREISQPDLWGELEKIRAFDDIEYEIENTMQQFTYNEIKQIQRGIGEIRRYLLNVVDNDEEDSKTINEKLDYLIESSERMGKKDWLNIFYGSMFSLSISLALNPEQGQTMINLFKSAVLGIVKFLSVSGA
ncbi:hypothetical protein [Tissierella sp.]|uniref:hypothetical protein n=1 Tax=Tissierella sp. TaxID=41274 RepID=UPI00285E4332|nr:hypothetical protein [Tissierella sp.]MDR7856108.1 hypothetical protein [Tissierella sp.]